MMVHLRNSTAVQSLGDSEGDVTGQCC